MVLSLLSSRLQADEAEDHFESKVRPVLVANCYACHTKARKGGLRLDSREAILKGGKSGPAIEVGNPKNSLLIQAVSRTPVETIASPMFMAGSSKRFSSKLRVGPANFRVDRLSNLAV
jgi:hypothetical protein